MTRAAKPKDRRRDRRNVREPLVWRRSPTGGWVAQSGRWRFEISGQGSDGWHRVWAFGYGTEWTANNWYLTRAAAERAAIKLRDAVTPEPRS